MAEIIYGSRAKFLHIDGFLYYKHSGPENGRRYWRCRKRDECEARATTTGGDSNLILIEGDTSKHSHAANREEVAAEKIVRSVKRLAKEHPELPPSQILRRELRAVKSGRHNNFNYKKYDFFQQVKYFFYFL